VESSTSDPAPSAQQQKLQAIFAESARLRQASEQLREEVQALLDKSSKIVEQSRILEQRLKELS